ncbi:MAG: carbohydrate kinase [Cyclobacteriaceae bacterium]
MKVLAFGEVLWDIINDDDHLGGAPLNFAAHFVKCGGDAAIMSKLGKDQRGETAYERINKLGVDASYVQWDDQHPTGTVPIKLVNGQPEYFIVPGVAYDFIDFDAAKDQLDQDHFDVLYFGTVAQRGASGETLKKVIENHSFKHRFYDVNLRKDCYNEAIIRFSLANTDIFKVSEEEINEISLMLFETKLQQADFIRRLIKLYPNIKHVIITAGGDGCYVYDKLALHHIKSEPVHVVDAIGAGDSFSAAFMYTYVNTADAIKSATIANKIGGFVAASSGAIPEYSEEIKGLFS